MKTLQYSRQKPENNDPSEVWMPALASNADTDDTHTHNGTNSPTLVGVTSISLTTQAISGAAWGADLGGGIYRQLITLPTVSGSQLQFDGISIEFRLPSTGEVIYPTIVKVSATTYYIYIVDNTLAVTAYYTT